MTLLRWARTRPTPVDPLVGWLASMLGLVLLAGGVGGFQESHASLAVWWNVAGLAVAALIVMTAATSWTLPTRTLRWIWTVAPLLQLTLLATWAFAYTGSPDAVRGLWAWRFETAVMCYLVLIVRPGVALAGQVASGLLPVLSAWLAFGTVPAAIAGQAATHVGNVGILAIFLGVRALLANVADVERDARRHQRETVVARARTAQHAEFARVVHDEVLATLTAAMRLEGEPPPELRQEARHAIGVIDGARVGRDTPRVAVAEAVENLVRAIRDAAPDTEIVVTSDPGELPVRAVETIRLAASEAARNTVRHAGAAARWAEIEAGPKRLRVAVCDAGPGFDSERLPEGRLGVRESILARMEALPGGDCVLESGRTGTMVDLSWRG
ncbi:MAG: ATP-binding protein [Propionicimonas sp.]|uniref:sensor histidine kinase n=1 Tax=Propionicimonas sp. TaxID=1955623 RepID=UPI003D10C07B